MLARTANIDRTSVKAFLNNDPLKSARMAYSKDLATKILAQPQGNFALVEKHLAFEKQALKNIAAVIPRIPTPSAHLFKDVGFAAMMQVAPQHIMPTYRATALSHLHLSGAPFTRHQECSLKLGNSSATIADISSVESRKSVFPNRLFLA